MRAILNRLEASLGSLSPPATAAFCAGVSDAEIAQAEEELAIQFPDQLREFLSLAGGQQSEDGFYPIGNLIVPRQRLSNGDYSAWGFFHPLSRIVEMTKYHMQLDEFGDDDEHRELIGPVTAHHKHIILTGADDPMSLALDLAPGDGGAFGEVVTYNDQPDLIACLAPSLSDYLETLADGFRDGRFRREDDGTFTEADA